MSSKDIMSPEEEEQWLSLQIEKVLEERENGTSRNATADRANDTSIDTKEEPDTEGSGHPRYSECTCGYKGCKVPLKSHSSWCDYREWREYEEDQERKRKEYGDIRIWF